MSKRRLCLFVAGLLLASSGLHAQLAPSPDEAPVSHAPAQPVEEATDDAGTLRMEVNLVDLFFFAKAKDGSPVPHLTKDDCTISEDKVPQTPKSFTAETHLPLTLGILLDTSRSQTRVLPIEQEVGSQFVESVLHSKDQAMLVGVDSDVNLLQDLTSSPRLITRALDHAEISGGVSFGASPVPTPGGGRGTVLYDAVYLAARQKLNQETGRKALILLTDGEDQGSRYKLKDAISAAERSNIVVYVILIADVESYLQQGEGYYGYSPMKELTEATGGRLFNVGNNAKKLQTAFNQIEEELRTQYIVTYAPTNTKRDGSFRKVSVECHNDVKVLVRKGYYAPAPSSADQ